MRAAAATSSRGSRAVNPRAGVDARIVVCVGAAPVDSRVLLIIVVAVFGV